MATPPRSLRPRGPDRDASTLEGFGQPVVATHNSSNLETLISSLETFIRGFAAFIHGTETAIWWKSSDYFESRND
jgi:hypothetical protein